MKQKSLDVAIFGMLGALLYVSKLVLEFLPNVHLIGTFIVAATVVYRARALYPIYVFVLLSGIFGGFSLWWIPYLYIWTILWAATMLLPKNMARKTKCIVYPAVCCLYGLLYGTLYAPAQAVLFGMSFKATLAWIVAGFPFDALHGLGNLFSGLLIVPLSDLLQKLAGKV